MKTVFLDSGPIISLTTSNLLHIIESLSKKVKFAMTKGVKHELVDRPLETRRFKFEALQVQALIENNVIKVIDDESVTRKAKELLNIANSIIYAHGHPVKILQIGEIETIAAAILYEADVIAIDERITRTLIEFPKGLQQLMEKRLHTRIQVNQKMLKTFKEETRHISIIRSTELATIAFEQGLLDKYIVDLPRAKQELLESILWSIKLHGCSMTEDEINEIVKMES